jgi:hypothetical protein
MQGNIWILNIICNRDTIYKALIRPGNPERGVLLRGPATVLSEKIQTAVFKMWHNISTGNIVLFGMVT